MGNIIELKKAIRVIGKSIRTTNAGGKSISDQSEFWKKFFAEKTGEEIEFKANPDNILGVYSGYESDYMGYYTFSIGFEADERARIPGGFHEVIIPASEYNIFSIPERESLDKKVGKIWTNIWNSGIERKYDVDFEVYDLRTIASDNPDVRIYVGIK